MINTKKNNFKKRISLRFIIPSIQLAQLVQLVLLVLLVLLISSVLVGAVNQGWIPSTPDADTGNNPPTPPAPTPTTTPTTTITYDNTLQLIEINAEVDGNKGTLTNSGEKISKQAKQGSDVELEINLKNIWDKEIKNIGIEIVIKDIDEGDDLDESAGINLLSSGESEKASIKFDLPLKIDDDTYDIEIIIMGRDKDNNIHKLEWESKLEVKKEKHNVKITKAALSPSTTRCGGTTRLDVGLLNLGREEEEVKLEINNQELELNFKENIGLDTGTDNDAEYEKSFRLNIPVNIGGGTYPISITADYGSDSSTKKLNLIIENCLQTKQDQLSIKVLPPTTSETLSKLQAKSPSKTMISFAGDESSILFLGIILFIVLALIIFLLGVIMIQLKR